MVRVVVTGLGLVTPLGLGVQHCWTALINGRSGIKRLKEPDYDNLPAKVAALVPEGQETSHEFDMNRFSASEWRQMSKATAYGLVATEEALKSAEWLPENQEQKEATGVAIGTGMLNFSDIIKTHEEMKQGGYRKVSPYFVPRCLNNMTSGHISIKYNVNGPNHSTSTACTTGAHSIGDAFTMIKRRQARVMLCGGTEASICPLSIAGFCRLRALSTIGTSRPFDSKRDGFVMAEGAGIIVLEELNHALTRLPRPTILAELKGYGLSGDGNHLTAPDKNGRGAYLSMKRALDEADLPSVDYVNAHATSTPLGDEIECRAVEQLYIDRTGSTDSESFPLISSTKGSTGHLLGAAGAVEAIFTILSIKHGFMPGTLNLENRNFESRLKFVTGKSAPWPVWTHGKRKRSALTNSFGFGGTNASLCFVEFKE